MDKISIEGLEINAIIGVHDWEKSTRQQILVDIDLYTETTSAATADDLKETKGYGDLARAIVRYVEESRFNLIETLAENLASLVLEQFSVPKVKIRVNKPGAIENARNVSVTIERASEP